MKNLINHLESNPAIAKGEGADIRNIMIAQSLLRQNGLPVFPEDFSELLGLYNGLFHEGASLWGIKPSNSIFFDIVEENLSLNPPSDLLILGFDEWDYLVYNEDEEAYQLNDKNDFTMLYQSKDLAYILHRLLKI